MVVDWFGLVMWCTIKMSNLPVGGAGESPCPMESTDEEVCYIDVPLAKNLQWDRLNNGLFQYLR